MYVKRMRKRGERELRKPRSTSLRSDRENKAQANKGATQRSDGVSETLPKRDGGLKGGKERGM